MVALLGVIGWAFIPHQATKQALKLLHYGSVTFLRIPAPAIGTFEYQRHYRYTFAVVVLGYLIYTMIQGSNSMLPNYYEILGVSPTADETALKLAFRQFAKKYHPDRVGPQGEALFIRVRDAFEALKNPTVRFAYDRFGPDVLGWSHCSTVAEYLRHGLTQSIGYHVVAGLVLVFWTAIGETSPVAFWRYLLYFAFFSSELYLLLSPSPGLSPSALLLGNPTAGPTHRTLLHVLFPRRVAYQHILFLHQLFLFLSIALSRVAPQFFPDPAKVTEAMTTRLLQLVCANDRETSQLIHLELHALQPQASGTHVPLAHLRPVTEPSEDTIDVLSAEMEKMIIEGAVRQVNGPFKSAWEGAVERGWRAVVAGVAGVVNTLQTPTKSPQKQRWDWLGAGSPSKKGLVNANGSPAGMQNGSSVPWVNGAGSGGGSAPTSPRPSYVRGRSVSMSII